MSRLASGPHVVQTTSRRCMHRLHNTVSAACAPRGARRTDELKDSSRLGSGWASKGVVNPAEVGTAGCKSRTTSTTGGDRLQGLSLVRYHRCHGEAHALIGAEVEVSAGGLCTENQPPCAVHAARSGPPVTYGLERSNSRSARRSS